MNNPPALVYTPGISSRATRTVDEFLYEQGLYRYDDIQESPDDLALPAVERPILRRVMLYAVTADGPTTFVADDLSSLGPDPTTRTAVVGALLQLGLDVLLVDVPLEQGWYQRSVRRLGFETVDAIMSGLLDMSTITEPMLRRWADLRGNSAWLLPTSITRYDHDARLKIKELVEMEGLNVTEVARRISVGGYKNRHNRVTWYPEAVRKAYEAGL